MDSGFNPAISHPRSALVKIQTASDTQRKPFYMGGSQVPMNLGLTQEQFSGAGFIPSPNTKTYIPKTIRYYKNK